MEDTEALRWLLTRQHRGAGDVLPASLTVARDWLATADSVRAAAATLPASCGPIAVPRHQDEP